MGLNTKNFRTALERRKGRRDELTSHIAKRIHRRRILRSESRIAEKAQAVIQLVAQETQEQLQYQLSELPKLALKAVFDDPADFEVAFELRRGKPEADFWLVKSGQRIINSGFGEMDIVGGALRPSLWSLQRPRTRPCILLDEPFKHLKGSEPNIRALHMLKEICRPQPEKNWPGIQIIMIADERAPREELKAVADKMWEFSMKNNMTNVKEV